VFVTALVTVARAGSSRCLSNPLQHPFIATALLTLLISGCLSSVPTGLAQTARPERVSVRLIADEAEAVLAILRRKKANQAITESDWQRVFTSEGYVRLKQRETSMNRSFEDADFKQFVLSDQLEARLPALEETLMRWKRADTVRSANLALAYLPNHARIRAKIYPVIKPRDNSFVFDVKQDPAIFLYLDPAVGREKFENTLAHELHHIGYGSGCPARKTAAEISAMSGNQQMMVTWIGAFGEGFAMLAAAGGPDAHPHAASKDEERSQWDKDIANFNSDLKKVDAFFTDILAGGLSRDEAQKTAATFYGIQGPWYTVGWKMSVAIEKTYGRPKLIECVCDQRKLLPAYNRAVSRLNRKGKEKLALWSGTVVAGLKSLNAR